LILEEDKYQRNEDDLLEKILHLEQQLADRKGEKWLRKKERQEKKKNC
jgi:DNA gyrase/topoisomerase IV subunit A